MPMFSDHDTILEFVGMPVVIEGVEGVEEQSPKSRSKESSFWRLATGGLPERRRYGFQGVGRESGFGRGGIS